MVSYLPLHQTFVETPPYKAWVLAEASELHLSHYCSPVLLHFLLEAHLILTLSSLAPIMASQRSLNRYAGCLTTSSKALQDLPGQILGFT